MTRPKTITNKRPQNRNKGLHPRNIHRQGYNFEALTKACPNLAHFITQNEYGNTSINFANPAAVKALNRALLKKDYNVSSWDIPDGFLCPPIPGRVDYLHYAADLLQATRRPTTSQKRNIRLLDIGTGANGIYALLACKAYGWDCAASDIDPLALQNLATIIGNNPELKDSIELRLQPDKSCIFEGVIRANEKFDITVCNPPFHASLKEALKGNQKKRTNLATNSPNGHKASPALPNLNFGGQNAELWCKGGEQKFLRTMIKESRTFSAQCTWFTTLVSKSDNLPPAKKLLRKLEATAIKEIEMKQGHKITRILAWSYRSQ